MADDDPITFEDILAEAQQGPRVVKARVLLRQDLLDQHADLERQLEAAVERDRSGEGSIDDVSEASAIAARILDLQADIEAAKREFVFKRIGKKAWSNLLAAHPPTKEQRDAARGQYVQIDNNPLTFPAAAIAASCVSPAMTHAQVSQFEEMIDVSQFTALYQACLDANIGGGDTPKSMLAGGIARVNAQLGLLRTTTESLDLSSLDGETKT